tara:strand:+ start:4528 stop:4986 length:459 start_codon:yes stop_codon:yes gene_type:complete
MEHAFRRAWDDSRTPVSSPGIRAQVAALCYRDTADGKRVLLITSRDTGRWIVPKGWPIEGLDGPGAALQEAWEEAGVHKADIETDPVGCFQYNKRLDDGESVPVEAQVYLTKVHDLLEEYPEADQRERAWFAPLDAANLVAEPALQAILRAL